MGLKKIVEDTKTFIKRVGILSIAPVGAFGLIYLLSEIKNEEIEGDRVYQHTSESISHLDGKPGTSIEDWRKAYNEALGKNFDVYYNLREQLTRVELETISTHYSE